MSVELNAPSHQRTHSSPHPLSDPNVYLHESARGWYATIRPGIEMPITIGLLIVTAPFLLLFALLVRLTSRGPAIYSQMRLGQGGQPFRVYKIRSMVHECERTTGPRWSTKRDPRVLPIGRLIRFLHIDELPQLWNVLRGEMSLIGPRPERPEFVLKLDQAIPRYRERLRVRPGLTGFAQVQLPADCDLESVRLKLAYDLYYVDNMGFWFDARIFVSTILKMVGVPFRTLRFVFVLPAEPTVDAHYWKSVPASVALSKLDWATA